MDATRTKNLFLRDRKGKRHFLVVVCPEKSVDLKALAPVLEVDRLVMGSAGRMLELLGVEPGSVTILGLAHDIGHQVELILDGPIAEADVLRCHPLVNTATFAIPTSEVRRFLEATGHAPRVLEIAERPAV